MITHPNVKVNLGLNILRKRSDGYHDLETLFVPYYGISDTLEIIEGDDFSHTSASLFAKYGQKLVQGISSNGKLMISIASKDGINWNPLEDLCSKAYFLMDEKHKLPPVKIFLEKTVPVGAGLGGGSSDAAFTLKMLSDMFELHLDNDIIAEYASELGSDCPFFVYNSPMIGKGKGNILTAYDLHNISFGKEDAGCEYELKLITPQNIAVSTAEAYRNIIPIENSKTGIKPLEEVLRKPVEEWKNLLFNGFETTVFKVHPELAKIKQSLYDSGAVYASMSGSGYALFGIYRK